MRPRAVSPRRSNVARGAAGDSHGPGHRRAAHLRRRWAGRLRCRDARGKAFRREGGGHHHRHLPARSDPHRNRRPSSAAVALANRRRRISPSSWRRWVSPSRASRPARRPGSTAARWTSTLLERQESEIEQFDYSWSHFWRDPRRRGESTRHPVQLPCWITFLGEAGKRIIQENIGSSAMYGGAIGSRGPRYCPSVEDKIVKFPAAERHQLFLEPEGHDTSELYVNGLSTSLPAPVQVEILRTVPGLERVRMTRAGYAIEYDYYPPTQLDATLQVKAVGGSVLRRTDQRDDRLRGGGRAGDDRRAQRRARFSRRLPGIVLGRESSYIGVLIDDLVTRGVDEPYRLFTSRSEFRLTVRQDNALRRLSPDRTRARPLHTRRAC